MTTPTRRLMRDFRRIEASGTGAAAADVTVPADERWLIKGVSVSLVTLTGGGNRSVRLELVDTTVKGGIESPIAVAGDEDVIFMFGPGLPLATASVPPTSTSGTATVPMFEFVVNAGEIVRGRVAANGVAGDVIEMAVHAEVSYL